MNESSVVPANSRMELFAFLRAGGFNSVSKVRVNSSGYKYVTLANTAGTTDPLNVYLGSRFADTVVVDQAFTVEQLKGFYCVGTVNANQEYRLKLSDKSAEMSEETKSNYTVLDL